MVITCEVLWSARLNTIMRYINRRFTYLLTYLLGIDKKIVPVSEKLRRNPWDGGTFNSKGGRRQQSPISTTVNGDCSTSHLRQRPAYESGRRRSKRWSTSQHLDNGWSRLKTEVYYEVVIACSAACIRSLAKLSLATFSVTEPANWL